jgi:hypothetical protein
MSRDQFYLLRGSIPNIIGKSFADEKAVFCGDVL